ncbi:MAG: HD domain-containing phosphohydrolase [Pseudothermotoga sp.]
MKDYEKIRLSIFLKISILAAFLIAFALVFFDVGIAVIEVLLLFFAVVGSVYLWKLWGGIISSLISSVIFLYGYHHRLDWIYVLSGLILFSAYGLMMGLVFKYLDTQRKNLKEVGEEYKRLSEQFRKYFDLVHVMIVGLDAEGNVMLVNNKTCEILGYSREQLIGKNWFKHFISNGVRNGLTNYFEQVKDQVNGDYSYHENPILSKDGTERIIVWRNTAIKDDSGKVIGTLSTGLDITELKQTQQKLTEQLELSRNLYKIAEQLTLQESNVSKRAKILTQMCVEILGVSLAFVGYAAPDRSVKIVASCPEDHPYVRDLIIRWDDSPYAQGAVGRSIKTGEYQLIEDTMNDERFKARKDKIAPFGLKTVLSFPLISPFGVFGVLVLYSDKYGFFSTEKIEQIRVISHLAAASLENSRLFEELQKRLGRIQALHQIDKAISASTDLNVVLSVLLDQVIHQLRVHAADIYLFDEHTMTFEYAAGRGFRTGKPNLGPIKSGTGLIGQIALNKRPIKINGDFCEFCEQNKRFCDRKELFSKEGFVFYAGVPLIAKGHLLGVLEVFNRSVIEENGEWSEFLQVIAQQTAIAIDSAKLFEDLQKRNVDLMNAYDATIEGWAYALDLRDKETEGHSERVTELTLKIAKKMGISKEELVHIKRGALLHDIGKMGIPDQILLKPGKLTEQEWEIMKKHPVYAYQMLSRIEYLRPALDIPYCHHEKWDGSGYPRGLKGQEIPLSARIFAVADVYDALTSDRPYRKAWSKDEAVRYIKDQSGKHFDPKVVEVFLKIIEEDKTDYNNL